MTSPWAARVARTFALGLSLLLLTAAPVAACSCGTPPMTYFAERPNKYPDLAVFTGVIQPDDGNTTPVKVERWFHGPVRPAVVLLAKDWADDPMDEAACYAERPKTGSRYIYAFYEGLTSPDAVMEVGLCDIDGDLDTAYGQQLLAEARELFGEGMPETDQVAFPSGAPDQLPDGLLLVVCTAALGAGLFVTRRITESRSRGLDRG